MAAASLAEPPEASSRSCCTGLRKEATNVFVGFYNRLALGAGQGISGTDWRQKIPEAG